MRTRSEFFLSLLFFLWAFFVLLAYYHNFLLHQNREDSVLPELLFVLCLSGITILAGNRILLLFRLKTDSLLEEALYSFAVGQGLLSSAVFLLAALNLLYPVTIIAILGLFAALALSGYRFAHESAKKLATWNPCLRVTETALISLLGIVIVLMLFNTLTPPVSRDALIHHLALPKLYLDNHGLVEVPFADAFYYPPLLEMLFLIGMAITSDIAAKLIHFSFYLATLLGTYVVSQKLVTRPYRITAVCLFATLPVVCQVSSLAYVDLGLTFYTIAGIAALLRWHATDHAGYFSLGGIMVGFAVGCKYNGLIVLGALLVMIAFSLARRQASFKNLAGKVVLFFLLALSVNILWMGRNIAWTGNPLYPQGNRFFGTLIHPEISIVSQYQLRNVFYGETLWDQILLPWNLSTKIKSRANHELDGLINPIFLIVLPGLLFVSRKRAGLPWILYFCLLYFLFFWASSRVRLRYLMPIYPLLSIMVAYVLARWNLQGKKFMTVAILFIAFQLNLYWAIVYINSTKPFEFLTGKSSRAVFLRERIPSYSVFEYANANLPPESRILFLYGGNFGNDTYYLNHDFVYQTRDLSYPVRKILATSHTPGDVHHEFRKQGITHLLVNPKLLQFDLTASLDQREQALFSRYAQELLSLECTSGNTALYRLR